MQDEFQCTKCFPVNSMPMEGFAPRSFPSLLSGGAGALFASSLAMPLETEIKFVGTNNNAGDQVRYLSMQHPSQVRWGYRFGKEEGEKMPKKKREHMVCAFKLIQSSFPSPPLTAMWGLSWDSISDTLLCAGCVAGQTGYVNADKLSFFPLTQWVF